MKYTKIKLLVLTLVVNKILNIIITISYTIYIIIDACQQADKMSYKKVFLLMK